MKDFESNLMTLRELFELRGDGYDVDKNYYIPQYQRNYKWSAAHTEKLIEDIYDIINGRTDDAFQPYFIGGIVLSRESLEDDKVSKVSFEVVDGQQRLTTLAILLACLLHEFKASNRNYKGMQEIVDSLANKIRKLLFSTVEDYVNYKTYERLNVQRSDSLSEPFSYLITSLSELKPLSEIINNLNSYKPNNDFPKDIDNLNNVVKSIFIKLDVLLNSGFI